MKKNTFVLNNIFSGDTLFRCIFHNSEGKTYYINANEAYVYVK
ncbi:N-acetylmuramoyl-L-alanine amidase [Bacillus cereus]|nr:N-acetylmuramoyl-L-alanine amidase [Bacillus cereus]RXJ42893.1 N-acetylmuramoyl-L-alanine amidase [Bacillus albus]